MREAVGAETLIASARLDRVDALPVGSGHLDLGLFGRGGLAGGLAGGALDYEHHVATRLSLFGEGWAGYGWGNRAGLGYGASAGLRMRW